MLELVSCFVMTGLVWLAIRALFPVVPTAEQIAGFNDHLNRWLAGGQVLKAHLFTNNFVPTPNNILTDYTELTALQFPGYSPITVTPIGTPFINPLPQVQQIFSDPVFQPSSAPASPVTIYGYFITLHPLVGADTLLYGVKFDNPKIAQYATDAIALDPDLVQQAMSSPISQ